MVEVETRTGHEVAGEAGNKHLWVQLLQAAGRNASLPRLPGNRPQGCNVGGSCNSSSKDEAAMLVDMYLSP